MPEAYLTPHRARDIRYVPWLVRRKVAQVEGHDEICAAADRGCEDMAVIRVRKCQRIDQVRIACHKAIADGSVHQGPGPLKPVALQFRIALQDVAHPLVVDFCRPPGLDQTCLAQANDKIANRG
jgi:hypothetical protein